jgi:hypothetical protein
MPEPYRRGSRLRGPGAHRAMLGSRAVPPGRRHTRACRPPAEPPPVDLDDSPPGSLPVPASPVRRISGGPARRSRYRQRGAGPRPDPFAPETGSRPGTVGNPCVPPEPRRVHMKSDRPSMERIDRSLVYSSAIAESGVAFTVTRQRDKEHGTTISCSIFRTPPPGRPPPGDRFPGHGKSRPRPLLSPAGTGPATAFPSLRRPSSPAPGPLAARAPERPPETACRPPGGAIRRVGRAFDPHRQIADQRPPHGSSC